MTRINLVDPSELTDQHLMAEYREIKMVPRSLERSIRARGCVQNVQRIVPPQFTLNTGHVSFFYDKMMYLALRHGWLFEELLNRGVEVDRVAYELNRAMFFSWAGGPLFKWYVPTDAALRIIRERIAEKIAMKPSWYRYKRIPLIDPACEYEGAKV